MTKLVSALAGARRGQSSGPVVPGPAAGQAPVAAGGQGQQGPTVDDLYRQHAARIAGWVGWLSGPQVDVDDIVHEIFLVVHRRVHTLRADASIPGWLYGITIRVVSDRRRSRRWRRWFGFSGGAHPGATAALKNAPARSATPLEALEQEEARRVVYLILDALSEDHRTVLILFELQGLSGQEIADATGTSVANVWLRLHRARKQFSQRLAAWEARNTRGGGR